MERKSLSSIASQHASKRLPYGTTTFLPAAAAAAAADDDETSGPQRNNFRIPHVSTTMACGQLEGQWDAKLEARVHSIKHGPLPLQQ